MTGEEQNEADTTRPMSNFEGDVAGIKNLIDQAVRSFIEMKPEQALLAHQAEWHIKGLIYHFERLLKLYDIVGGEVGSRALTVKANFIVMYSPDMQDLIFEFYALVSLARITLDELVKYVRPLFARSSTLPKSINDFLKGQTDCPLASMLILGGEELLRYLVDIRNCIVHYRTFATSDNTLAVAEGVDETQLLNVPYFDALRSVTRVYFRYLGGTKVSVNVLLPDKIFGDSGSSKKLVQPFSYSLRYRGLFGTPVLHMHRRRSQACGPRVLNNPHNLLSQSREFVRLCTAGVAGSLYLRGVNDGPTFSWTKR